MRAALIRDFHQWFCKENARRTGDMIIDFIYSLPLTDLTAAITSDNNIQNFFMACIFFPFRTKPKMTNISLARSSLECGKDFGGRLFP